jgi:hypothetical protein
MESLARLFDAWWTKKERGIYLDEPDAWEVTPTRDVERFLRALPLLVPEDGTVYFEGTGESHVAEYLREVSIAAPVEVAKGTIWPRPDCYHVPLTAGSMEALARFLEEQPAGYFCSHCHVYRDRTVLLQWHDAFADDPFLISRRIPRSVVAIFADALGCSYLPLERAGKTCS